MSPGSSTKPPRGPLKATSAPGVSPRNHCEPGPPGATSAQSVSVAPARAIAHELAAAGFERPATLVYWARDPSWLVYDGELRALARQHAGFAYHPVTPADGEPAAVAERLAGDVAGLVVYVAGGEPTIKAVRAAMVARGMERKAVKWEKFW